MWLTIHVTELCLQLTAGSGTDKRRWALSLRLQSCERVADGGKIVFTSIISEDVPIISHFPLYSTSGLLPFFLDTLNKLMIRHCFEHLHLLHSFLFICPAFTPVSVNRPYGHHMWSHQQCSDSSCRLVYSTCLAADLSVLLAPTVWQCRWLGWQPSPTNRAFPVVSPWTWNDLPDDVTSAKSLSTFRQRLKTHLFTKSFFWLFRGLDFT